MNVNRIFSIELQAGKYYDCFRIHEGIVVREEHHKNFVELLVKIAEAFLPIPEIPKKKKGDLVQPNFSALRATIQIIKKRKKDLPTHVRQFQELLLLVMFPGHTSHVEVISSPSGEPFRGDFYDLRCVLSKMLGRSFIWCTNVIEDN